jgi:hypothetical protein
LVGFRKLNQESVNANIVDLKFILGESEKYGVQLLGLAIFGRNKITASLSTYVYGSNIGIDLTFWPDGLESIFPDYSLYRSSGEAPDWNAEWLKEIKTLFFGIFREIAATVPVEGVLFGMEGSPCLHGLKESELQNPYTGAILPKDHYLAKVPGGQIIDVGNGYLLFDLGEKKLRQSRHTNA